MIQKIIDSYCRLLGVLMVVALGAMVIMVFGNVVMRYAFNSGITISEELSRWLFLWVIFLGATIAVRERAHMGTDMLVAKLPAPLQKLCLLVGHLLMLFATWLLFKGSLQQVQINWSVEAPVSGFSQAWADSAGLVFATSSGLMLLLETWRIVTGQLTLNDLHAPAGLEPTDADLAAHDNKN